jgi:hypothetical protein
MDHGAPWYSGNIQEAEDSRLQPRLAPEHDAPPKHRGSVDFPLPAPPIQQGQYDPLAKLYAERVVELGKAPTSRQDNALVDLALLGPPPLPSLGPGPQYHTPVDVAHPPLPGVPPPPQPRPAPTLPLLAKSPLLRDDHAVPLQVNRPGIVVGYHGHPSTSHFAVPSLEQLAELPPGQIRNFSDNELEAIIRAHPGSGVEWPEHVARDQLIEQVIVLLWTWESAHRYHSFRSAFLQCPEQSLYGIPTPNDHQVFPPVAETPSEPPHEPTNPGSRNPHPMEIVPAGPLSQIQKARRTGRGGRLQCDPCRAGKRGFEVCRHLFLSISC